MNFKCIFFFFLVMNKTKAKYPPQGVEEGGVGGRECHMKSDGGDRLKF